MEFKEVEDCTIYKVIHGSHAYGFATEASDKDIRGICIPRKDYFLSMDQRFEQYEAPNEDTVIYNIQKYFNLAVACNPNVIELIFIDDPKLILKETSWIKEIKENRDLFLSMKAKHTFSGYAFAQLKRIQTHRKWLLEPPTHCPTRDEFGLDPKDPMSSSQMGALNKMIAMGSQLDGTAMEVVRKENAYRNAKMHWDQYQTWQKERNPARAELEKKYGYDTKHASHLVRLMRMGLEILKTGKVIVQRPDAAELLEIRRGLYSYDDLMSFAEEKEAEMTALYEQPEKCAVPYTPDRKKLNELLISTIESYWAIQLANQNVIKMMNCMGDDIKSQYKE